MSLQVLTRRLAQAVSFVLVFCSVLLLWLGLTLFCCGVAAAMYVLCGGI